MISKLMFLLQYDERLIPIWLGINLWNMALPDIIWTANFETFEALYLKFCISGLRSYGKQ